MALQAYLTLTAKNGGAIAGCARADKREGKIVVFSYDHVVDNVRDPKSGQPAGKPTHHVVTITKEVDHATPLLHKAHAANDLFTEWKLDCWRNPPTGGDEENHFSIWLVNARIARMRSYMLFTKTDSNYATPELDEISFTYEKIVWGWKPADGQKSSFAEETVDFSVDDPDAYFTKAKAIALDASKSIGSAVASGMKEILMPVIKNEPAK